MLSEIRANPGVRGGGADGDGGGGDLTLTILMTFWKTKEALGSANAIIFRHLDLLVT